MGLWPHQIRGIAETQSALSRVDRVVLTSPTGGGKSRMIAPLIEWGREAFGPAVLLTPRKMLTEQLHATLTDHGIRHGVRAAGYSAFADDGADVQLCSIQTEIARKDKIKHMLPWKPAFVLADEAHLFTSSAYAGLLAAWGGKQVLVTATPLGMGGIADDIVVAGENRELRECGALLPAKVFAPDEPEATAHVRKVKVSDAEALFAEPQWRQQVFGRVLDHWRKLNPDGRPTILFAPGIAESVWFVDEFEKNGIRAAHIDGEDTYLDGNTVESSKERRDEILDLVRRGEVQVLCNRFVFREGVDLPELYHLIFACPIGSLSSYLQAVGRVLRFHASLPGHVIVQDHGGNWWRHGSPNESRGDFWCEFWQVEESEASAVRHDRIRENKSESAEPIHCPECHATRRSGAYCGECGARANLRVRNVLQADGTLRPVKGRAIKPRKAEMRHDTVEAWERCYWRASKSKKAMTFGQARGLFFHEHRYWPPEGLPLMPKRERDWYRPVKNVPRRDLTAKEPRSAAEPVKSDGQQTLFVGAG